MNLHTTLAIFWIGLLVGVSFLVTPIKFSAPSLTLPVALEVGRVTFSLLLRVETFLLVLLLACSFWARAELGMFSLLFLGLLSLVLASQSLWLQPVLDARVGEILAGNTPPASIHHALYIACECIKLLALSLYVSLT